MEYNILFACIFSQTKIESTSPKRNAKAGITPPITALDKTPICKKCNIKSQILLWKLTSLPE